MTFEHHVVRDRGKCASEGNTRTRLDGQTGSGIRQGGTNVDFGMAFTVDCPAVGGIWVLICGIHARCETRVI